MSEQQIELLSKISPKSVCGKIEKDPKDKTILFTVFGIASGIQAGESNMGPWECLTGQFEAVRATDGAVFQAGRCFLPSVAHNPIAGKLKALADDDGKAVRFALQVGIKPSDSPVGYEYTVLPVLNPVEDDAMADLRKIALLAPDSKPALPRHTKQS